MLNRGKLIVPPEDQDSAAPDKAKVTLVAVDPVTTHVPFHEDGDTIPDTYMVDPTVIALYVAVAYPSVTAVVVDDPEFITIVGGAKTGSQTKVTCVVVDDPDFTKSAPSCTDTVLVKK